MYTCTNKSDQPQGFYVKGSGGEKVRIETVAPGDSRNLDLVDRDDAWNKGRAHAGTVTIEAASAASKAKHK